MLTVLFLFNLQSNMCQKSSVITATNTSLQSSEQLNVGVWKGSVNNAALAQKREENQLSIVAESKRRNSTIIVKGGGEDLENSGHKERWTRCCTTVSGSIGSAAGRLPTEPAKAGLGLEARGERTLGSKRCLITVS